MGNNSAYLREFGTGIFPRWYGMVGVIVALLGSTIPLIIGLVKAGIDWWWIVLFPILLVLFIVICFLQYRKVAVDRDKYLRERDELKQGTSAVEFYTSRSGYAKSRGGLTEAIASCREVWLTMWTGSKTWQSEVFKQPNVKRLIIQHPEYEFVKTFAKAEKGDLEVYRRTIIATTGNALDNNVRVVWAQEAIIGMVIAREKDGNGWARVECFLPHSETPDAYPSFVVYENNKNETDMYQRFCKSYEDMFGSDINVCVTKEILRELKEKLGIA